MYLFPAWNAAIIYTVIMVSQFCDCDNWASMSSFRQTCNFPQIPTPCKTINYESKVNIIFIRLPNEVGSEKEKPNMHTNFT